MYYKIVTCRCYAEILNEREKEIIGTRSNFSYSCNRPHEVYIWKCDNHPFVFELLHQQKTCFFNACLRYEVCSCCVEIRYKLSYRCPKFCLSDLSDYFKNNAVKIEYFLDEKNEGSSFFILKIVSFVSWIILFIKIL